MRGPERPDRAVAVVVVLATAARLQQRRRRTPAASIRSSPERRRRSDGSRSRPRTSRSRQAPSRVPSGETTITVTNEGAVEHSFTLDDESVSEDIEPGESVTVTVDVSADARLPLQVPPRPDDRHAHGRAESRRVLESIRLTAGTIERSRSERAMRRRTHGGRCVRWADVHRDRADRTVVATPTTGMTAMSCRGRRPSSIADLAFEPSRRCRSRAGSTAITITNSRLDRPHVHVRRPAASTSRWMPGDGQPSTVSGELGADSIGVPLRDPRRDDRDAAGRLTRVRPASGQTLKESPQAHSCVTCGFRIFRPPPSSASSKSSVEPSHDRRAPGVDQHAERRRRPSIDVVVGVGPGRRTTGRS